MPELEHQQGPESVAVEGSVIRLVETEELLDGTRREVAPLPRAAGQEDIPPQLPKTLMRLEPLTGGQAEPVLYLGEDLARQETTERALEDVALLRPPNLVRRGDGGHELHERVIEHRESYGDAGRLGRPDHLEEVIVGQGDLEIDVEKPVELGRGRRRLEVTPGHLERPVGCGGRLKIRMEQPAAVLIDEELARVEAIGIRQTRALDIPSSLPGQARRFGGKMTDKGFDESVTDEAGDQAVAGKDAVPPITFVAAEDLVAAVARQQDPDPGLPRQPGAEICREGGVVAEGLIVGCHEIGKTLQGLFRRDDLGVVGGVEMACGQLGVLELVVVRLLEAYGEGVHPLPGEVAHESHDGAAIGASAQ